MKKNGFWDKFPSWGRSNSVLISMQLKEKKYDFWELKKNNIHRMPASSSRKLKIQDLHDLFLETLFWIHLCPAKKLIQIANTVETR